jgi:inosose dehydratase
VAELALRLATGPVSWGVDFADAPGNPPWREVLDGIAASGLRWMELGPFGYLPEGIGAELMARRIGVTAGLLFEPFHDPSQRAAVLRLAAAVARRVRSLGGRHVLLIDRVSAGRSRTAGHSTAARRLEGGDRARMLATLREAARIAADHGVRALVHPHAGSYVEFEDEIEPVAQELELCLDTGHLAYAGLDPVAAYLRWADRTPYLHLKDIRLDRRAGDFWASVRAGAFCPLGDGDVDLGALLAALDRSGFGGWAVLEQDRRPGGDPVGDLIAGRRHLERLA